MTRLAGDPGVVVRAAVRTRSPHLPAQIEQTLCELDDRWSWRESLHGVTTVVHLAARVHLMRDRTADPLAEYRRVNVAGTLNLARQAAAAGVRRFVALSSVKVNGESGRFQESDPPAPQDAYGVSKWEAEIGLRAIAAESSMEVTIIRPPLVYGPSARANFGVLMRAIARGIPLPLGAVRNRRSLIGMDNLVDFIVTCMEHPAAANDLFFVSDGEDLSTTDLIRRLARVMGRRSRLVPVPPGLLMAAAAIAGRRDLAQRLLGSLSVDITKAQRQLAWSPPVPVDEGLLKAVADLR